MIVFYKEFKIPVTGRIFSIVFLFLGICFIVGLPGAGIFIGLPLVLLCFTFWGLFIEACFDPIATMLTFNTYLFGIKIHSKRRQIKVNHLAMTRILMKSKVGIGSGKLGGMQTTVSGYQYSLQLIFDENQRELIESFTDVKKMNEMAYELALQMQVKIFDATTTPQKWFDPLTGEEKIAEFKKRKR